MNEAYNNAIARQYAPVQQELEQAIEDERNLIRAEALAPPTPAPIQEPAQITESLVKPVTPPGQDESAQEVEVPKTETSTPETKTPETETSTPKAEAPEAKTEVSGPLASSKEEFFATSTIQEEEKSVVARYAEQVKDAEKSGIVRQYVDDVTEIGLINTNQKAISEAEKNVGMMAKFASAAFNQIGEALGSWKIDPAEWSRNRYKRKAQERQDFEEAKKSTPEQLAEDNLGWGGISEGYPLWSANRYRVESPEEFARVVKEDAKAHAQFEYFKQDFAYEISKWGTGYAEELIVKKLNSDDPKDKVMGSMLVRELGVYMALTKANTEARQNGGELVDDKDTQAKVNADTEMFVKQIQEAVHNRENPTGVWNSVTALWRYSPIKTLIDLGQGLEHNLLDQDERSVKSLNDRLKTERFGLTGPEYYLARMTDATAEYLFGTEPGTGFVAGQSTAVERAFAGAGTNLAFGYGFNSLAGKFMLTQALATPWTGYMAAGASASGALDSIFTPYLMEKAGESDTPMAAYLGAFVLSAGVLGASEMAATKFFQASRNVAVKQGFNLVNLKSIVDNASLYSAARVSLVGSPSNPFVRAKNNLILNSMANHPNLTGDGKVWIAAQQARNSAAQHLSYGDSMFKKIFHPTTALSDEHIAFVEKKMLASDAFMKDVADIRESILKDPREFLKATEDFKALDFKELKQGEFDELDALLNADMPTKETLVIDASDAANSRAAKETAFQESSYYKYIDKVARLTVERQYKKAARDVSEGFYIVEHGFNLESNPMLQNHIDDAEAKAFELFQAELARKVDPDSVIDAPVNEDYAALARDYSPEDGDAQQFFLLNASQAVKDKAAEDLLSKLPGYERSPSGALLASNESLQTVNGMKLKMPIYAALGNTDLHIPKFHVLPKSMAPGALTDPISLGRAVDQLLTRKLNLDVSGWSSVDKVMHLAKIFKLDADQTTKVLAVYDPVVGNKAALFDLPMDVRENLQFSQVSDLGMEPNQLGDTSELATLQNISGSIKSELRKEGTPRRPSALSRMEVIDEEIEKINGMINHVGDEAAANVELATTAAVNDLNAGGVDPVFDDITMERRAVEAERDMVHRKLQKAQVDQKAIEEEIEELAARLSNASSRAMSAPTQAERVAELEAVAASKDSIRIGIAKQELEDLDAALTEGYSKELGDLSLPDQIAELQSKVDDLASRQQEISLRVSEKARAKAQTTAEADIKDAMAQRLEHLSGQRELIDSEMYELGSGIGIEGAATQDLQHLLDYQTERIGSLTGKTSAPADPASLGKKPKPPVSPQEYHASKESSNSYKKLYQQVQQAEENLKAGNETPEFVEALRRKLDEKMQEEIKPPLKPGEELANKRKARVQKVMTDTERKRVEADIEMWIQKAPKEAQPKMRALIESLKDELSFSGKLTEKEVAEGVAKQLSKLNLANKDVGEFPAMAKLIKSLFSNTEEAKLITDSLAKVGNLEDGNRIAVAISKIKDETKRKEAQAVYDRFIKHGGKEQVASTTHTYEAYTPEDMQEALASLMEESDMIRRGEGQFATLTDALAKAEAGRPISKKHAHDLAALNAMSDQMLKQMSAITGSKFKSLDEAFAHPEVQKVLAAFQAVESDVTAMYGSNLETPVKLVYMALMDRVNGTNLVSEYFKKADATRTQNFFRAYNEAVGGGSEVRYGDDIDYNTLAVFGDGANYGAEAQGAASTLPKSAMRHKDYAHSVTARQVEGILNLTGESLDSLAASQGKHPDSLSLIQFDYTGQGDIANIAAKNQNMRLDMVPGERKAIAVKYDLGENGVANNISNKQLRALTELYDDSLNSLKHLMGLLSSSDVNNSMQFATGAAKDMFVSQQGNALKYLMARKAVLRVQAVRDTMMYGKISGPVFDALGLYHFNLDGPAELVESVLKVSENLYPSMVLKNPEAMPDGSWYKALTGSDPTRTNLAGDKSMFEMLSIHMDVHDVSSPTAFQKLLDKEKYIEQITDTSKEMFERSKAIRIKYEKAKMNKEAVIDAAQHQSTKSGKSAPPNKADVKGPEDAPVNVFTGQEVL